VHAKDLFKGFKLFPVSGWNVDFDFHLGNLDVLYAAIESSGEGRAYLFG
jgi:hypothetical protein